MKWSRVYALFVGRNIEFMRDRSALAWNLLLPILIIVVFAYAFSEENPEKFKVGLVVADELPGAAAQFRATRYIKFIEEFPMTVTGKIQKFKMREAAIRELGLEEDAGIETA